jgi:hypothetical protein
LAHYPKQPFGSHTPQASLLASDNAALCNRRRPAPATESLDEGQATAGALPRPPSRLISAPLQSPPPATGAVRFHEPRGKEETPRPPFPLANDPAAVLAVKGPLRRFAPLTAPGHREKAT